MSATVGGRIRDLRYRRGMPQEELGENAAEKTAELYTRDPAIIRQLDSLVTEYPDTFKCVGETDIDKSYVMPKTAVTYRKPRRLSEEQRKKKRSLMEQINKT